MTSQAANNVCYGKREAIIVSFPANKNRYVPREENLRPTSSPEGSYRALRLPDQARDSSFVRRFIKLIEANLDDDAYRIEQICRDIGASRTSIHLQLKRWTGLSTSKFIRLIRLRKAIKLLLATDLNVTQVAYEVGFKDAHYFSRVFTMSLGVCPKVFRQRERGL